LKSSRPKGGDCEAGTEEKARADGRKASTCKFLAKPIGGKVKRMVGGDHDRGPMWCEINVRGRGSKKKENFLLKQRREEGKGRGFGSGDTWREVSH